MRVSLHPAAERGLFEAAAFYEREGSPALAMRFVAEFKRLAALIAEHPEIGSPRKGGRRGFAMSVFPYTVMYRPGVAETIALVIKHDSRRPGYGSSRR